MVKRKTSQEGERRQEYLCRRVINKRRISEIRGGKKTGQKRKDAALI